MLNATKFTAKKLDIFVPGSVDVVWSIIRPKKVTRQTTFKDFIVAGFYSPPGKGKNSALQDHLTTTANSLLSRFPKAGLIIGGDRNCMNISPVINACQKAIKKSMHFKGILFWKHN